MSKHTAGPWFVEQDKKTPIYVSPVDRHEQIAICSVFTIDECDSESGDFLNGEQTKANAKLIAAAPDLLEALIAMNAQLEAEGYMGTTYGPLRLAATKAIAKALGQ